MCYDTGVFGSQVQLRVGCSPGSHGSWWDWVTGRQLSVTALRMRIQSGQVFLGWLHWCGLHRPLPVQPMTSVELAHLGDAVQLTAVLQALLSCHSPGLPISSD